MRIRHLTPVFAAALLAGCAQPPTQQIDLAKSSLESARIANAADYASAAWTEAADLDSRLDAELQVQRERSSLMRSYDQTRKLATALKAAADRAVQEAAAGKETAKHDAEASMTRARQARDRADQALAAAPRGKGAAVDLASLRSDNTATDATLDEMQKEFDAGEYLKAKAKAEAVINACDGVVKQIEAARSQWRAG